MALALWLALLVPTAQAAPAETVAGPGQGAGQVDNPHGVTVDPFSGDLYIADRNNFRVDKFDSNGDFLLAWGFGVADNESTELQTCGPQATPPSVKCFHLGGNIASMNTEAGNIAPESVAVDAFSHDVYVADSSKRRVTRFTAGGEFVFLIGKNVNADGLSQEEKNICTAADLAEGDECGRGESGAGVGEFFGSLGAVFVDSSSRLWVGDNGRVIEFDSEGGFVSEAPVPGGGGIIKGLGIDPMGKYLYLKSSSIPGIRRYTFSGGSPTLALTEVPPPLDDSGQAEAFVLDSTGGVYVGARTDPYHFLRFSDGGKQTTQFGGGQVIGTPGLSGGVNNGGNPLALNETARALYSASSRPGVNSAVQRFTLPEPGPLPESPTAEEVLPTTATLKATLNPEGHETTYRFQYLTQQAYEEQGESFEGPATLQTPEETLPGSEYKQEEVSAALEGLLPDTAYRFRLIAGNECETGVSCETQSENATFTTPTAVEVVSQWTDDVTASSATFKAQLDPLGVAAEWRLEYGTTESYGTATEFEDLGSGFGAVSVARQITGLAPDTLYHYRFVATDERDGIKYTVNGPDQTLLTALGELGFTLPDGRAWEQVSPLRKGSGRIVPPWLGFTQASEEGDLLTFVSFGPVAGAEGSRIPEVSQSLAHRRTEDWTPTDVSPPHEVAEELVEGTEYRLFAASLCRAAVEPRGRRAEEAEPLSAEASERTPYLRENCSDPPRWRPLVTGKKPFANVCAGTEFGASQQNVLGGSPALEAVILRSSVPLTCDAEKASGALYGWSGGELELISRLPDDEGGKVTGQATLGSAGSASGSIRSAVSEDGRYVYWQRTGGSSPALYARDTLAAQSLRLDTPQPHSFGGADKPVFQGASADGTRAFFTDTRHLTPDAGETGADLYQCEIVESAGEAKCQLKDLTPETEAREAADVQGVLTALDEEGDDLYLVANGKLAPGAIEGDCADPNTAEQRCNLYHAHREGGAWSVDLVAVLSGADSPAWAGSNPFNASTASLAATASPDGRYLAFMSQLPLTGYESRDAASGEMAEQVFRYDSVAEELACVSCNPSGARPRAAIGADGYQLPSDWQGLWTGRRVAAMLPDAESPGLAIPAYYRPRAMLANGRVLFNAFDSLVPADSNGTSDAYQYEPWGVGDCSSASKGPALAQAEGGACLALLSSGTSERESAVLDSSASGDDVFIITASQLSVLDEDPGYDIYDVRVGGTAASREALSECLGEACQSPAPAPEPPGLPTAALAGNGNLRNPSAARCTGPARAAKRLARRAQRMRRRAKRTARQGSARSARRMSRRARRLSVSAKQRSAAAKRCRRRVRVERRARSPRSSGPDLGAVK